MIIECYTDEVFEILDNFYYLYCNIDFVWRCYEVGQKHFEAQLWEIRR